MDTQHLLDEIVAEFDERLRSRRALILDVFEGIFSESEQWRFVRQKLLKFLGDSGLRGDFIEVIEHARRNRYGSGTQKS